MLRNGSSLERSDLEVRSSRRCRARRERAGANSDERLVLAVPAARRGVHRWDQVRDAHAPPVRLVSRVDLRAWLAHGVSPRRGPRDRRPLPPRRAAAARRAPRRRARRSSRACALTRRGSAQAHGLESAGARRRGGGARLYRSRRATGMAGMVRARGRGDRGPPVAAVPLGAHVRIALRAPYGLRLPGVEIAPGRGRHASDPMPARARAAPAAVVPGRP